MLELNIRENCSQYTAVPSHEIDNVKINSPKVSTEGEKNRCRYPLKLKSGEEFNKVAPRSSAQFKIGPEFGETHLFSTLLTSSGSQVCPILNSRIDRGFEKIDNEWVGYKRNYFTLVAAFQFLGMPFKEFLSETFTVIDSKHKEYPVRFFSINLISKCSEDESCINLVQHTAKRDRGPQFPPPSYPAVPGALPNHEIVREAANIRNYDKITKLNKIFYCNRLSEKEEHDDISAIIDYPQDEISKVARYERIQFSSSINFRKPSPANKHFKLVVQLSAITMDDRNVCIAQIETPPLVIRGRSPSNYRGLLLDEVMAKPSKKKKCNVDTINENLFLDNLKDDHGSLTFQGTQAEEIPFGSSAIDTLTSDPPIRCISPSIHLPQLMIDRSKVSTNKKQRKQSKLKATKVTKPKKTPKAPKTLKAPKEWKRLKSLKDTNDSKKTRPIKEKKNLLDVMSKERNPIISEACTNERSITDVISTSTPKNDRKDHRLNSNLNSKIKAKMNINSIINSQIKLESENEIPSKMNNGLSSKFSESNEHQTTFCESKEESVLLNFDILAVNNFSLQGIKNCESHFTQRARSRDYDNGGRDIIKKDKDGVAIIASFYENDSLDFASSFHSGMMMNLRRIDVEIEDNKNASQVLQQNDWPFISSCDKSMEKKIPPLVKDNAEHDLVKYKPNNNFKLEEIFATSSPTKLPTSVHSNDYINYEYHDL